MKKTRSPVARSLMLSTVAGAALLGATAVAQAAPIYPAPNPPVNSLIFGDFTIYSLAYLTNLTGTNFNVDSTPGSIKDDVVALTGSSGVPVNTNVSGIDNAYAAPSGTGGAPFFTTGTSPNPGPTGGGATPGGTTTTWDASVGALRGYLGSGTQHDLVFYFNLNETGDADTLAGLDLLTWAKVTLHDNDGIKADKTFYLTGNPFAANGAAGKASSIANGGPEADPSALGFDENDDRWAYVHGRICVSNASGLLIHTGSCTGADSNAKTINQNLGADDAAFAAFNKELSDLVNDPNSGYDVMRSDFRLSMLDNGFEQVFIKASTVVPPPSTQVPEPTTLAVFGFGLAGLGMALRRGRRRG